ncbi:hypothetical protein CpipJ_CPIJ017194 [Culex quinquefasciatus]|uniref:Uncharacterized protein n=1 Tax=Culex quinquefasciatus TaxID=7176 RepID=B0XDT7_CULQU|nr:hypothetical protein CpipJ_CPIJ017194 [Culex quinquefasciatus]|eukprot:XP_001867809.1 hypothetical protein CpipJ_CPIJ017194 [Culex quinquefasciatus]
MFMSVYGNYIIEPGTSYTVLRSGVNFSMMRSFMRVYGNYIIEPGTSYAVLRSGAHSEMHARIYHRERATIQTGPTV